MFKILHNILPKSSRLHRLNQKNSPACSLCPSGIPEDCLHALLVCSYNNDVNNWILNLVRKAAPNCKLEDIITLNFQLSQQLMFPTMWLLSHRFCMVWLLRSSKKAVHLFTIQADIEAKINILRKSRFTDAISQLENLINL